MKTKFLYPVLCLLLWSCNSDDEATVAPELPEPAAACFVQEAVTTLGSITTKEKYTYNDKWQLVKTEHFKGDELQGITEHQYDEKGRLLREQMLSAAVQVKGAVKYEFNARDQVVRYTTYEAWLEGYLVPKTAHTCVYDSTVLLRSTSAWRFVNNQPVQQEAIAFTYRAGKLMHKATITGKDKKVTDKITITLDNKHTPLFGVQPFRTTKFATVGYPQAHNILTYTVLDATDKAKLVSSYTSAFSYNAQGYPTQVTSTYGDNKVRRTAYTYACP